MGAVPGGRLLSDPLADPSTESLADPLGDPATESLADPLGDPATDPPAEPGIAGWFDVEPYRTAGRRVTLREVDHPVLVLGSTQRRSVVDIHRAAELGVQVARRRSGGGAVLLQPGAQLWADMWVPRDDPLWTDDPRRAAAVVGRWWADALGTSVAGLSVHDGASVPSPGSDLVCFAGTGPGEVLVGGRKLVGLAQWRSREGALVHGCAYRRWDPAVLVGLLATNEVEDAALRAALVGAAVGLDELGAEAWSADDLVAALPAGPPWAVVRT